MVRVPVRGSSEDPKRSSGSTLGWPDLDIHVTHCSVFIMLICTLRLHISLEVIMFNILYVDREISIIYLLQDSSWSFMTSS